jgi:hypothetical protein
VAPEKRRGKGKKRIVKSTKRRKQKTRWAEKRQERKQRTNERLLEVHATKQILKGTRRQQKRQGGTVGRNVKKRMV